MKIREVKESRFPWLILVAVAGVLLYFGWGAWRTGYELSLVLDESLTASGDQSEPLGTRGAMLLAAEAVTETADRLKKGDLYASREAWQSFEAVYGDVLGPVSLENPNAARQIAGARERVAEALAKAKPDAAAVRRDCDAILQGLHTAAEAMGVNLTTRASSGLGDVAEAPGRVISVTAREYRFEPATIQVQKGERVTIRFTNAGTERHEFELEAFGFEIEPIPPGSTVEKSFVANKSGTFEYACHVDQHYEKGMKGRLIVR